MTIDRSAAAQAEQARRFAVAVDAAKLAAQSTLARFQDESLRIDRKLDRSLVTEADRGAEAILRALITEAFPRDAIVGEEFGNVAGASGWTWYLDPIDGTQSFARGVPLFGTLIGVTFEDVSAIGAIVLPALDEAVYAAKGAGATWERGVYSSQPRRTPARVSPVRELSEAVFCTTGYEMFTRTHRTELFAALSRATAVSRGWSDCYAYALVATGRAEVAVDPILAPWDAGPMPVLLAEAGGRYTSLDGRETLDAGSGVATNGILHDVVLALAADG